jgi:hypothetical protein
VTKYFVANFDQVTSTILNQYEYVVNFDLVFCKVFFREHVKNVPYLYRRSITKYKKAHEC